MIKRLFLPIAVILILCSAGFAQAKNTDDVKLRNLIKEMIDAQIAFSPERLDKIFADDYIEISPLGEVDDRAKTLGFYEPKLKPEKLSTTVKFEDVSVRNYGEFAIVISRIDYMITMDGKDLSPRSMRLTLACRNINGNWKISSSQYTAIRPKKPQS